MTTHPQIICIGSVLWDIIGRCPQKMVQGNDVAGRITRLPGGVAMNIAMALNDFGITVALLSAVGRDNEGDDLLAQAAAMGLMTQFVHRTDGLPTDRYMAIEGENGLIAAIADAHSLEAAEDLILTPLYDGQIASAAMPWKGMVALDGNLTRDMLQKIAKDDVFAVADLRIAPASPGKATRLDAFLGQSNATLYLNLEEANLLVKNSHSSAADAAKALMQHGLRRVLVTNGASDAAMASEDGIFTQTPPPVRVARITGAGDYFMAAHMAAEMRGEDARTALKSALKGAADHISAVR